MPPPPAPPPPPTAPRLTDPADWHVPTLAEAFALATAWGLNSLAQLGDGTFNTAFVAVGVGAPF